MAPVYKTGTSLESIIEDGWPRNFEVEQTVAEAQASGYTVDAEYVHAYWVSLAEELNEDFPQDNHR